MGFRANTRHQQGSTAVLAQLEEAQPFELLIVGSSPTNGTILMGTLKGFPNPPALWLRWAKPTCANAHGLQVLKEAYPALTRAGGVRFPGNPHTRGSLTTEEHEQAAGHAKSRTCPSSSRGMSAALKTRRARSDSGEGHCSRVAQLEAPRSLKPWVAGSTPASGSAPVSASGRPAGFEPAHGRSSRSTGTIQRVGVGGLCPPEPERGRVWAPSQGAHFNRSVA